jgi:hypothetical protein
MKKTLTVSILLNLVLLICLVASLGERKTETASQPDQANSTGGQELEVKTPTPTPTVLSTLPAEKQSSESEAALASVPARVQRDRLQTQPILMPLVFQPADLTKLKLNDEQAQAISDLRQKFLDEIGGVGQDTNNPAYLEKWLKHQPEIDSDLRGMIGVTAFQNYQIEAADSETAPDPAVQTTREH